MQNLIEKIRKSREAEINVEGYSFIIKRPDYFLRNKYDFSRQETTLRQCVVGWNGIKELDLIAGGTGEIIPFSTELFMEWVADKPKFWQPLVDEVYELYKAHREGLSEAEKKLTAG